MNGQFPRVQVGTDEEVAILEEIKKSHRWRTGQVLEYAKAMLRTGRRPYQDTVRPGVIAARRRRGKAARKARRLNR